MIAYSVAPPRRSAVEELLQLLKVPSEPHRPGRDYSAVLSDGSDPGPRRGGAIVVSDLLDLVAGLFTRGLPEREATAPVLDLQVRELRERLRARGPLVEVPPQPLGRPFVVTLSHDIDQLSLAEHGLGPRWLSFLRQSTSWPLREWSRGGTSFRHVIGAWWLALRSPLVVAGLTGDPWRRIDAYLELEREHGGASTYFLIPYPGRAGVDLRGQPNHRRRGADYDLGAHAADVARLAGAGAEIGVHGIDAWCTVAGAAEERAAVGRASGSPPAGVRMHFLYFEEASFARLEEAGFDYDSSFGFPRAVGYRAGTLQPFVSPGCRRLMEFPVHLEDGSLRSPSALGLGEAEARAAIDRFLDRSQDVGGCLNTSWHDHSLGAPRYWGATYRHLLEGATARGAWLTTLGEACRWYRLRRQVSLKVRGATLRVEMPEWPASLPRPALRIHREDGGWRDVALTAGTHPLGPSAASRAGPPAAMGASGS